MRFYPTYKLTTDKPVAISWMQTKGMRLLGQTQRTFLLTAEAMARASQILALGLHVPQISWEQHEGLMMDACTQMGI